PTMSPCLLTPLPLIETSCESEAGLLILIVTVPALALRLVVLYLSWFGSALMLSVLPPPPEAAGVVLVDELLFFDEPQPATASATIAMARIGIRRFMRPHVTPIRRAE